MRRYRTGGTTALKLTGTTGRAVAPSGSAAPVVSFFSWEFRSGSAGGCTAGTVLPFAQGGTTAQLNSAFLPCCNLFRALFQFDQQNVYIAYMDLKHLIGY